MTRPLMTFVMCFVLVAVGSAAWHIYQIPAREFDRLERGFYALQDHGEWGHFRQLVDHEFDAIVRPNNDTLYSSTFIDLSGGPLLLTLPETGDRYYSVQFMDPMTNVYEVISRRTRGGAAGQFAILGPNWTGGFFTEVEHVVTAPTDRTWILVRFLIDGPEDLAAVHTLQDQLSLDPLTD